MSAIALCREAHAYLEVETRVTSVTNGAFINDPHSVTLTAPGALIHMDIVARITGTNQNTNDEGLRSLSGSLISASQPWHDRIRGTIATALVPDFSALGSSAGTQADLDGDGDLDVGSNNDPDVTGFFAVRAWTAPYPIYGQELRVGTATFRFDSLTSAGIGEAALFFRPRDAGTAAGWFEDGVQKVPGSPGTGFFTHDVVRVSAIPEPSAPGLFAAVATFASALRPQRRG